MGDAISNLPPGVLPIIIGKFADKYMQNHENSKWLNWHVKTNDQLYDSMRNKNVVPKNVPFHLDVFSLDRLAMHSQQTQFHREFLKWNKALDKLQKRPQLLHEMMQTYKLQYSRQPFETYKWEDLMCHYFRDKECPQTLNSLKLFMPFDSSVSMETLRISELGNDLDWEERGYHEYFLRNNNSLYKRKRLEAWAYYLSSNVHYAEIGDGAYTNTEVNEIMRKSAFSQYLPEPQELVDLDKDDEDDDESYVKKWVHQRHEFIKKLTYWFTNLFIICCKSTLAYNDHIAFSQVPENIPNWVLSGKQAGYLRYGEDGEIQEGLENKTFIYQTDLRTLTQENFVANFSLFDASPQDRVADYTEEMMSGMMIRPLTKKEKFIMQDRNWRSKNRLRDDSDHPMEDFLKNIKPREKCLSSLFVLQQYFEDQGHIQFKTLSTDEDRDSEPFSVRAASYERYFQKKYLDPRDPRFYTPRYMVEVDITVLPAQMESILKQYEQELKNVESNITHNDAETPEGATTRNRARAQNDISKARKGIRKDKKFIQKLRKFTKKLQDTAVQPLADLQQSNSTIHALLTRFSENHNIMELNERGRETRSMLRRPYYAHAEMTRVRTQLQPLLQSNSHLRSQILNILGLERNKGIMPWKHIFDLVYGIPAVYTDALLTHRVLNMSEGEIREQFHDLAPEDKVREAFVFFLIALRKHDEIKTFYMGTTEPYRTMPLASAPEFQESQKDTLHSIWGKARETMQKWDHMRLEFLHNLLVNSTDPEDPEDPQEPFTQIESSQIKSSDSTRTLGYDEFETLRPLEVSVKRERDYETWKRKVLELYRTRDSLQKKSIEDSKDPNSMQTDSIASRNLYRVKFA